MPQIYNCSFCGSEIAPGTGMNFARRDGRILRFCSNKCKKNTIDYKRDPRKFKWTQAWKIRQRRKP